MRSHEREAQRDSTPSESQDPAEDSKHGADVLVQRRDRVGRLRHITERLK